MSESKLTEELLRRSKSTAEFLDDERGLLEQNNRMKLRDSSVQIRQVGEHPVSPGSKHNPSFLLGDAEGFNGAKIDAVAVHGLGNMSEKAMTEFLDHLKDAASRPDAISRDVATGRAAKVVANELPRNAGVGDHHDVKQSLFHEARGQVAMAFRELGEKAGLNKAESAVVGFSLERALEREGIKVMANRAIDGISNAFTPSSASVATMAGARHAMEEKLSQSMHWLASKGITTEALKEGVSKHLGKLQVLATLSEHPEAVQRAAQVLSHSDKAIDGIVALAKDAELRKAVGTLTMAAGETAAMMPGARGLGSAAVVAGSAMRGDTSDETGRHVVRAGLSILGGAAGGVAGTVAGPAGTVGGAVAGQAAGSVLADKLIALYDQYVTKENHHGNQTTIGGQELKNSASVVADRAMDKAKDAIGHEGGVEGLKSRMAGMEREMSYGRGQS